MNNNKLPEKRHLKSQNSLKNRLNVQINQINSILNDFRKTRQNCLQLAKFIKEDMVDEQKYRKIETSTMKKLNLLDLPGLVNLKNQVVRALTQLFDIERQLRYKEQKQKAKMALIRQFQNQQKPKENSNIQQKQQHQIPKNSSLNNVNAKKENPKTNSNSNSVTKKNIKNTSSPPDSPPKNISKTPNMQIPIYRSNNETNQNKLDRISKYFALLKRNIKQNSKETGYKWKIKEFLLEDPTFLKLRNQTEQFQMRQQQLSEIIKKNIKAEIQAYVKKNQIAIEQKDVHTRNDALKVNHQKDAVNKMNNNKFRLIKVYKDKKNKDIIANTMSVENKQKNCPLSQQIAISQKASKEKPSQIIISAQLPVIVANTGLGNQTSQQNFLNIKKKLQTANQSHIQMLNRINETVQQGSKKLLELRLRRKNVFEAKSDNSFWDELNQI